MPLTTLDRTGFNQTDADGIADLDLSRFFAAGEGAAPMVENIAIVSDNPNREVLFSMAPGDASGARISVDFSQFDDLGAGEAEQLDITFDVVDAGERVAALAPLVVDGGNDAPEAEDALFAAAAGAELSGAFSATDPEGDDLTFSIAGAAPEGFSLSGDGRFLFTPETAGRADLNVLVEDGNGGETMFAAAFDVSSAAEADGGAAPLAAAPFAMAEEPEELDEPPVGEIFLGTDGRDRIEGGDGPDEIYGFAGNDDLSGEDGADLIVAGSGEDTLRGNAGADTLKGGADDDLILGQRGHDDLAGGKGDDTLVGAKGDDNLVGAKGHDLLIGGFGRDNLVGGQGADRLVGGNGTDVLEGGAGNDFLIGGRGSDRFVFTDNFGGDVIADFNVSLPLEVMDFTGHSGVSGIGDLSISQMGANTIIFDGMGGRIGLVNVDMADIDADDFLF
ncbi:calcium-binding protein [Pikeienuella sp. HZG-20]|uniref:calcium-binding protein n=1 Tax=Paludibacillus litoralis TaxID=3133267 RepID=UPI0030EF38C8